ncbi:glycosyltransferase family 2 protein [Spirosoma linguale]|uniref:Glycosyl transferase family 2 n=1 Tax=Spirosoma linguale (strain ATCC 33905 / DSM 74 / LMG 10896 / Claus 1) TaxID=504472 RepID=D2QRK1_SPILD|nr:glycosyl transferase family 2 [Spirosoma linguale DSM 74]
MIRISVCMATYNGELFLKNQLSSILCQLGGNDEIIVSDDGSVDDTISIINSFSDSRIKVFFNKNRHGPVGNFENALEHSSGEYIFLADQDDIWLSEKVDTIYELLLDYDLVLTDCEVTDHLYNTLTPSFFTYRRSHNGFWANIYRNSYMGCCMAFRRDVLRYALPFPKRIHMHDWWIGLLVEAKGRVVFYNKPLIKYVRHGSNASPTGGIGFGFKEQLANRFWLLLNLAQRLLV